MTAVAFTQFIQTPLNVARFRSTLRDTVRFCLTLKTRQVKKCKKWLQSKQRKNFDSQNLKQIKFKNQKRN